MEVDTKTSYIALALALALLSEETPGSKGTLILNHLRGE